MKSPTTLVRVLAPVLASIALFTVPATPAAAQFTASTDLVVTADEVISGGTVTITVEFSNTGDVPVTEVEVITSPASDCSVTGVTVQPDESFTRICTIDNVTEDIPFAVDTTAFVPAFDVSLTNEVDVLIEPGEYPGGGDPGVIPSFNPPGTAVSLDANNPMLSRAAIVLASMAAITALMIRRRHTS